MIFCCSKKIHSNQQGEIPQKGAKLKPLLLAILIITALGGVFILLAAYRILPQGTNCISDLGLKAVISGYVITGISTFTITTYLIHHLLFKKTHSSQKRAPTVEETSNTALSNSSNSVVRPNEIPEEYKTKTEAETSNTALSNSSNSVVRPNEIPEEYKTKTEAEIEELRRILLNPDESWDTIWERSRFRTRFSPFFVKAKTTWEAVCQELRSGKTTLWDKVSQKIQKAAIKAYPYQEMQIEWVTGTSSSTLIGMSQVQEKGVTRAPALVPTGTLLKNNITPMTGELSFGIMNTGVNKIALSGVGFDKFSTAFEYAETSDFDFNEEKELKYILDFALENLQAVFLRLKIAVLRLIHVNASPKTIQQAKQKIEEIKSQMKEFTGWESGAGLIGLPAKPPKKASSLPPPLERGMLVGVKRSSGDYTMGMIIRYYKEEGKYGILVDKQSSTKIVSKGSLYIYSQEEIQELTSQAPPLSNDELESFRDMVELRCEKKTTIESILKLFETEKALKLSSQEAAFLQKPFPIVFGSSQSLLYTRVQGVDGERAVAEPLELGSKITWIFTKKKHIKEIETWLTAKKITSVRVASFGVAHFLPKPL